MAAKKNNTRELAERLHSAAIHLLRRLRTVDETSGLTAPKLSALSVLVFGGSRTLGALAAAEQVRPASMTRIVQELEAGGLVGRAVDPADGRVFHVSATARGVRLMHEGRSRRAALLAKWMEQFDAAELETLAAAVTVLEKITRAR